MGTVYLSDIVCHNRPPRFFCYLLQIYHRRLLVTTDQGVDFDVGTRAILQQDMIMRMLFIESEHGFLVIPI